MRSYWPSLGAALRKDADEDLEAWLQKGLRKGVMLEADEREVGDWQEANERHTEVARKALEEVRALRQGCHSRGGPCPVRGGGGRGAGSARAWGQLWIGRPLGAGRAGGGSQEV